ncbi:MAG: hypothetical protein KTR32_18615 [Granulosicoccus sp.]|nr:hypothetical protein [Granulosicoccus sp.]
MNQHNPKVSIYRISNNRIPLRGLLLLTILTLSILFQGKVKAETITLQAITDFTAIDAGDVPFYRDTKNQRNVLAINAAVEEYRSRFATATTEFDGSAGFYDLELTTLGELDGDCVYQIIVNDEVMGTAVNTIASVDYEVQKHQFDDIYIPAGATLGVSAVAVSNGLIPENDAFAFARGRWRTLTLTSDNGGTGFTPVVDLSLEAAYAFEDSVEGSNAFSVSLTVSNTGSTPADYSATSPLASVVLPEGLVFRDSDDCSAFGYRVYCDYSTLAHNTSASVQFTVEPGRSGEFSLAASVIADERELNTDNNLRSLSVTASYDATLDPNLGAALAANTGGGSTSPWFVLFVCLSALFRRRRSGI